MSKLQLCVIDSEICISESVMDKRELKKKDGFDPSKARFFRMGK